MDTRLVVAAECPTCGAPLDFTEGATALRCLYCRSRLLVTGRKQVLSYAVLPRPDAEPAVAEALADQNATAPYRIVRRQIYFIPYYRLTGQELRWEKEPQAPDFPALAHLDYSQIAAVLAAARGAGKLRVREKVVLKDRHVEKNFVACPLQGVGVYSLGIRPAVLRLSLFQRQTLESLGKVVAVRLTPREALARGRQTDDTQVVHREMVGQVLSVLYFPFWVVEGERRGTRVCTVVDAVSRNVVATDVPSSLFSLLEQSPQGTPEVVGFRPLVCPNCGWELPVTPDDIIFFCSACRQAWQILGSELTRVPYQVIAPPQGDKREALVFLPFWRLAVAQGLAPVAPLLLPAFRYRRVKMLIDLARKMSLSLPGSPREDFPEKAPSVQGCYYDQDDALALARVLATGRALQQGAGEVGRGQELALKQATLTWVPFKRQGNFLTDPVAGLQLSSGLLL